MAGPVLSIDFETRSLSDLRRTGVHVYAEDPSTRVICMAWAFDDEPVQVWRAGDPFPQRVLDHVERGGRVRAFNAGFEWVIWNQVLTRQLGGKTTIAGQVQLSLSQIEDTMASAAFWGLPLSLDMAGPAAGLTVTKDKDGHRLMLQMTKPRRFNPLTGDVEWWDETDPEKLDRLCRYCAQDVEVERAIANTLPGLSDEERQTWMLDQRINAAGVGVDYNLVMRLRDLAGQAAANANQELARLTNGQVQSVNQHAAFLSWLQFHGYPYDNLRRATVEQRLDEPGVSDMERRGLEIRADVARNSAAKLNAMLNASRVRGGIGDVRGMLQYYGANRTGRWAGRLIQLQNMPRGVIGKNTDAAIAMIEAGVGLEELEALFGPAMGIVMSCLRGCIVARPGKKLVVADFSQIEARVVAWLAGQADALAVFASGQDIYVYTAAQIGSTNRQLGKVLVLACGFGMSGKKFKDTAEGYKVFLTEDEAEAAVKGWRANNSKIVDFWWACDRAARVVLSSGQPVDVGPVRFGMWGPHMIIRLPSGRPLVYRNARLIPSKDRPGEQEISYMGTNQYTRKWERLRTYGGKLVENITQATARDVMRDAMLRADREGIPVRLTVHDELITEPDEDLAVSGVTETHLLQIMRTPPAWAPDLPVDAAAWTGDRYRK